MHYLFFSHYFFPFLMCNVKKKKSLKIRASSSSHVSTLSSESNEMELEFLRYIEFVMSVVRLPKIEQ